MRELSESDFFHMWLASTGPEPDPLPINGEEWDEYRYAHLPIGVVWERIAPVIPDVLMELRAGVYEARWWTPVPKMDVEMLLATEGIIIIGHPYEPSNLPMGCAVRFAFGHSQLSKRGTLSYHLRSAMRMSKKCWVSLC